MAWITLAGAPYVTVSPTGLSNGLSNLPNNGADFGPDTPGTMTTGLQEALNHGGTIRLLPGAASFLLNVDLYVPSSGITVRADPGVTIQSMNNSILHVVNASNGTPNSWVRWEGNGAKINLNQGNGYVGDVITEPTTAHHLYFGGWEIYGGVTGFFQVTSQDTSGGGAEQQYQCIVIEDLYIHTFANVGSNTTAGFQIFHSNVTGRRIFVNATDFPSGIDHSVFFMRGGSAAYPAITEDCEFENCYVLNNGNSGQVLELQGNTSSSGVGIVREIAFRGCTFNSGASSPVVAGSGGPYIDDNNGTSNSSYVTNIQFHDCKFVEWVMSYQSTSTYIGSITFEGVGPQTTATYPLGVSGSLRGRDNNGGTVYTVSITATSSPLSYRNLDGCWEIVYVSGGTVSSITLNGIATGATSGQFRLGPGDILIVTYTSAPTLTKVGAAG
ncbi:MAG: hypothetical protein WA691_08435 [Thermoplasmata archaeon]